MQITITGKKLDIGDSLTSHIREQLTDIVDKYFNDAVGAQVVLARDGRGVRTDISVHVGRNIQLRAHDVKTDPYQAFDNALAHMDKRLRRHKRRLRDHHRDRETAAQEPALSYVIAAEPAPEADTASDNPVIIAEDRLAIERMSVSDAVMRLDLGDLPVMLFRNAGNDALNIVYRREDGNIAWVDMAGA